MAEGIFRQLTIDHWQQPGPAISALVRFSPRDELTRTIDGNEWARDFLAVELAVGPGAIRSRLAHHVQTRVDHAVDASLCRGTLHGPRPVSVLLGGNEPLPAS